MRYFSLLTFCLLLAFACNTESKSDNSTPKNPKKEQTASKSDQSAAAQAAQAAGKASASTAQNLSTGYWHIGGAVNTDRTGQGYDGEWIQFRPDQTYVYGKAEQDLASGTWIFNEDKEYITFQGISKGEGTFFQYEFQCKQIGDIILLLGNTPSNPKGMQVKLVRENTKVIEHNPN